MKTINNLFWKWLALFLAQPKVTAWLIARAKKTPYQHILSPDHTKVYMERYWLFNPYPTQKEKDAYKAAGKKLPWQFPVSIRIHRIMVPDGDRHHHDHPWNARTILLKGGYDEERLEYREPCPSLDWTSMLPGAYYTQPYRRKQGDTATLGFGEFHRITKVPAEGVWTLFITFPLQGDWGYMVDGKKVSFREYVRSGTVVDPN